MKKTSFMGKADRLRETDHEVDCLLNLIRSKIKRKEFTLAEEFARELLELVMTAFLLKKAARLNRLNRFLRLSMKLLLTIVIAALFCMVMNLDPLLWLKVFVAGTLLIALLILVNRHLLGRFYRGIRLTVEAYEKVSRLFIDLILDSVRANNNPEAALNMFRNTVMR